MAQAFPETAHLNIDQEKYRENYERIFGKKNKEAKKEKEDDKKEEK